MVQSRIKMLERMPVLQSVEFESDVVFHFRECEKLANSVLQLDEASFRYSKDSPLIFQNICCGSQSDSRICIVGENGSGKTTLLKVLLGELNPTTGVRNAHRRLNIGYHVDQLDMEMSGLELIAQKFPNLTQEEYRSSLARFGLTGDIVFQSIVTLSGGQKSRLAFACLSLQQPNYLILDEPTNHLDVETVDALGKALNHFKGGVILVSHDERLIELVCKELWVVKDKSVTTLEGGLEEYKKHVYRQLAIQIYDPLDFALCQLVLVVDGREQNNKSRFKTMSQHLEKCTVAHELRPLSVGDYLWIVKLANGKEMVLDYIIERKTWDDLKSSIRQTRYAEQKLRLKDSGIRNVIMVAEGMPQQDRSLEQALVTTSIDNRFLVHRTTNTQGTAKFLQTLTNYLLTRLKRERMYGPSFSYLQDASRKTKTLTVSDCWLRQLTVCPMVSTERAVQISAIFPTMHSMVEFYRNRANAADSGDITMLLHNEYPEAISKSISAQLSQFFCSAL
ncbi:ABC transporter domain-containing protein [Ditylenchus destructor]|nr:ABC transporter domain-containing protein [Ditylenchus destructor]